MGLIAEAKKTNRLKEAVLVYKILGQLLFYKTKRLSYLHLSYVIWILYKYSRRKAYEGSIKIRKYKQNISS